MKKKRLYHCAVCGKPLAEARPVFLMVDSTQEIRGPLHAGCAERIHLDSNRALTWEELATDRFGRVVPKIDQEQMFSELAPEEEGGK